MVVLLSVMVAFSLKCSTLNVSTSKNFVIVKTHESSSTESMYFNVRLFVCKFSRFSGKWTAMYLKSMTLSIYCYLDQLFVVKLENMWSVSNLWLPFEWDSHSHKYRCGYGELMHRIYEVWK